MTKSERETLEYKSLFSDERYAKRAWKDLIGVSLEGDADALPVTTDKDGNPTFQSQLDEMAYNNIVNRLKKQGIDRSPQQAEMIVECNILRSRFSDHTFNTILERTAGKVKDEIEINQNPYEQLTDEELEMLINFRNKDKSDK